jgi:hypothetical protein
MQGYHLSAANPLRMCDIDVHCDISRGERLFSSNGQTCVLAARDL